MAHHGAVAAVVGQRDGIESLGERADLVDLHQQRVGDTALDALLQTLRVGDEQVVADDLNPLADRSGQFRPTVPLVLAQRILDETSG